MEPKITSVESRGKVNERSNKTISHIEIHPKLGGGQVVTHVYTSYEHKPKEHKFGPNQGEGFAAHLSKHTGVPLQYAKGENRETEKEAEIEDEEE